MSSTSNVGRKKSTSTENSKKVGSTNPGRRIGKQLSGHGSADHFAQARIKELEEQVSDLKKRLDELRKAKNTTIIKKDKTYVTTSVPHNGYNSTPKGTSDADDDHRQVTSSLQAASDKSAEGSIEEMEDQQHNIAALKEMHRAEIEELRKEVEKQAKQVDSNTAAELEILKKRNGELLEENEKLTLKTTELQLRVDELLEELSKKEAEWCSREEKLLLEGKTSWGEKYQKWMAQTEQKIEELTAANNFLRTLLEKEKT